MTEPSINAISDIVTRIGKIPTIGADEDIYNAGVSSISSLDLLMELEETFEVTIPDAEFVQARTPRALSDTVRRSRGG